MAPSTARQWADPATLTIGALLAVTWLGVHASWGLTDPGDTLLSRPMRTVASIEIWLIGAVALLAVAVAVTWRTQRGVALVGVMLLAFLGVLWGRSVLETRGLGWAVCTHATLDLAFFLVQFVPAG